MYSWIFSCLSLWNNDRSLSTALELGKRVLELLDILNALWPCPREHPFSDYFRVLTLLLVQQARTDDLRKRLSEHCTAANLTQPLPPDYSLPPVLKG